SRPNLQIRCILSLIFLSTTSLAMNRHIFLDRFDEAMELMAEYSNIHEVIDSVVDDMGKYHDILVDPFDDEDTNLVKRETKRPSILTQPAEGYAMFKLS
ncbi:hypothetical protein PMAYCL1PPCAC_06082, partial [Pristionchus mayeri]